MTMSSLEEASSRLEAALERLDRLVSQEKAKRGEVQARVRALESENERLKDLASTAAERLDAAIAQLQLQIEA
jgi:hypothetical protein